MRTRAPAAEADLRQRKEGTDMPLVEITLWPGRGPDVKERIIREVTDALTRSCGAPADAIEIIIRDVPKTDWGRGGLPFSKTHP